MQRKEFLKALGLTTLVLPLMSNACKDDDDDTIMEGDCDITTSTTAGPFPTKNPNSLVITDITSGRQGVPLEMVISVKNQNNNCAALAGAIVDIWHCDKDGYYSEYGSNPDVANVHFLRGRQLTNAEGKVSFRSIFPGWYPGRAPHLHIHIFDSNGSSLKVSQIAFPDATARTVYTTSQHYASRGEHDTASNEDGIFRNKIDTMMPALSGDITNGYNLMHTIVVEV